MDRDHACIQSMLSQALEQVRVRMTAPVSIHLPFSFSVQESENLTIDQKKNLMKLCVRPMRETFEFGHTSTRVLLQEDATSMLFKLHNSRWVCLSDRLYVHSLTKWKHRMAMAGLKAHPSPNKRRHHLAWMLKSWIYTRRYGSFHFEPIYMKPYSMRISMPFASGLLGRCEGEAITGRGTNGFD